MNYLTSHIIKVVKSATPATVSLFLFHYPEFIIKQIAEKKKHYMVFSNNKRLLNRVIRKLT